MRSRRRLPRRSRRWPRVAGEGSVPRVAAHAPRARPRTCAPADGRTGGEGWHIKSTRPKDTFDGFFERSIREAHEEKQSALGEAVSIDAATRYVKTTRE